MKSRSLTVFVSGAETLFLDTSDIHLALAGSPARENGMFSTHQGSSLDGNNSRMLEDLPGLKGRDY